MCYITCFYGSELLIHLRQQSPSLNKDWEKVALAELKPLKYCLYTIRYEFLRFAQSVELMSDFALSILSRDLGTIIVPRDAIETTDTEIKPSVSMKAPVIEASVQAPLETFFPFDPCYLISLHQYIDKYYRPWRGLPGLNGDGSSIDAMSHADEEESSCVMSTADGKQHNHSTSVSSSNMSSVASNAYYGMSGLSNVTFSMHGSSHINENASTGMSKSGNLASEGDDHASLGTFKRENVDFGTREEGLLKTAPMRRPRQYSISSTGSW